MSQKLTLESLEVLDAIDRRGSFAAAAAALYRVPSKVTYTVNKLEADLGVTLFRKEGRRSVLTPAGRMLMQQGREILQAAERLVESTRQLDSGWESCLNVTVDTLVDFKQLDPLLTDLYQLRPEIELNLYQEVLGGTWESIIKERVDLVIGAPEIPVHTQGLSVEHMMDVEWTFAVARGHPLTKYDQSLGQGDIEQYRAVVVRDSSSELPPLTRRVLDRQTRLVVPDMTSKIAAQIAGQGVGFLPRFRIGAHLQSGQLVALNLSEPTLTSPMHIAWRSSNKGKALNWLVARLKEQNW